MSKRGMAASLLILLFTILPLRLAYAQGGRANAQRGMGSSSLDPDDPFDGPSAAGGGQISGTVRSFDGHGVADATIVASDLGHASVFVTARSDSNGRFTMRGLQRGNYDLNATSGLEQASERVNVSGSGDSTVEFHLSKQADAASNPKSASVSLPQYQVPGKARSLYEKASQLLAHGKTDQSLDKVNAAITAYPRFSEALTLRGIIEERTGKTNEALNDYRNAIEYDANYALAYIVQASLLNSTRHFTEAVPILGQVSRLAPNLWQVPFEMSRSCLGRGDLNGAMSNIDRASQLHGGPQNDLPVMHLLRGYAYAGLSNLEKATEEIHAYLAHQPTGPAADAARRVLEEVRGSTISASR
jgi:hypothetical protein